MINNAVHYPLKQNRRNITLAYICSPMGKNSKTGPETLELKFFKKLPAEVGFDHKKIIFDSKIDVDE